MWTLALLVALATPPPGDPNTFDPLLDVPPASIGPGTRLETPDARSPGMYVGTFGGLYMGNVRSVLTEQLSELEGSARAAIGFGFGYRSSGFIDFGVDVALGLGSTWSPKEREYHAAFDLLLQPRLLAHWYETPGWGVYSGLAADLVLYDVEQAGLNQAGVGPSVVLGLQKRLGPHSLVFIEGSYGPFFDFLAYRFEEPTEAELMEEPDAPIRKVIGAWYHLARVSVGYRLTAL